MNSVGRRLSPSTLLCRLASGRVFEFWTGSKATFARNLTLTIAGVVLLVLSVSLRLRASCDSSYLNWGFWDGYVCTYNSQDCGGDVCETDDCNWFPCGVNGSGWITYCVVDCGAAPGCLGCPY